VSVFTHSELQTEDNADYGGKGKR